LGISLARLTLSNLDRRGTSPNWISFNQNLTPFVNFLLVPAVSALESPETGRRGFFPLSCLDHMVLGSGSVGLQEGYWVEVKE
jgi:hypothetical protein